MNFLAWKIEERKLELKYSWAISRNTSEYKINFFVSVSDGNFTGVGEAAPNIRYDETPELIRKQFSDFSTLAAEFHFDDNNTGESLAKLTSFLNSKSLCHALRFAIESACIHLLCKRENKSIYSILGIKPAPLPLMTSYSLPIMQPGLIKEFFHDNHLKEYAYLKIKINIEYGYDSIREISKLTNSPLMIDGNECWEDVENVIRFIEKLKSFSVLFMEQPMPAIHEEQYIHLKKYSALPIIADESCTSEPDMSRLEKQFHGVNMKLMKAGGYIGGLKILNEARALGMKTMIGCMVETSIGIASAINLCHGVDYVDLDGFLILKNEPFGLLKEKNGGLYFNE